MTPNKQQWIRDKPVLKICIGFILIMLVVNAVILSSKNRKSFQYPSGIEIEEYALSFSKNRERERLGKKMDCSDFTRNVYKHFGIKIARSSRDQSKQSRLLDVNDLVKGNLIFFGIDNNNKVSHVGIFLGNGKFIHSPGRGRYVRIDSLNNDYWEQRFIAGGRVIIQ